MSNPTPLVRVESLEHRTLFAVVVVDTAFDPIVGPVGPTPGSIGLGDVEPVVPPTTTGGGVFVGVGNGGFVVISNPGGVTPPVSPAFPPGHTGGALQTENALRRGYPVYFPDGSSVRLRQGTLTITGTNFDDDISVSRPDDTTSERPPERPPLDVVINGRTLRLDPLSLGRFATRVVIDARSGDDVAVAADDLELAVTIRGGSGDDSLAGGLGNDSLDGGSGQDVLLGGDGNDLLTGGTNNDTLDGGAGNDNLLGGRGNDRFFNFSAVTAPATDVDALNGGLGTDKADEDSVDQMVDVETLI